ncbi:collagen alpha-1(I) chain-like [Canis lupus familiaris]|uniref:collagen alpha-1(I) chain-like n=1 Tax=Canis lupus familiaris TaxID=9615 RepID=UPI0018F5B0FA|nr:collagen alpha-1(I) chain-like [Canis lupus familiaris]
MAAVTPFVVVRGPARGLLLEHGRAALGGTRGEHGRVPASRARPPPPVLPLGLRALSMVQAELETPGSWRRDQLDQRHGLVPVASVLGPLLRRMGKGRARARVQACPQQPWVCCGAGLPAGVSARQPRGRCRSSPGFPVDENDGERGREPEGPGGRRGRGELGRRALQQAEGTGLRAASQWCPACCPGASVEARGPAPPPCCCAFLAHVQATGELVLRRRLPAGPLSLTLRPPCATARRTEGPARPPCTTRSPRRAPGLASVPGQGPGVIVISLLWSLHNVRLLPSVWVCRGDPTRRRVSGRPAKEGGTGLCPQQVQAAQGPPGHRPPPPGAPPHRADRCSRGNRAPAFLLGVHGGGGGERGGLWREGPVPSTRAPARPLLHSGVDLHPCALALTRPGLEGLEGAGETRGGGRRGGRPRRLGPGARSPPSPRGSGPQREARWGAEEPGPSAPAAPPPAPGGPTATPHGAPPPPPRLTTQLPLAEALPAGADRGCGWTVLEAPPGPAARPVSPGASRVGAPLDERGDCGSLGRCPTLSLALSPAPALDGSVGPRALGAGSSLGEEAAGSPGSPGPAVTVTRTRPTLPMAQRPQAALGDHSLRGGSCAPGPLCPSRTGWKLHPQPTRASGHGPSATAQDTVERVGGAGGPAGRGKATEERPTATPPPELGSPGWAARRAPAASPTGPGGGPSQWSPGHGATHLRGQEPLLLTSGPPLHSPPGAILVQDSLLLYLPASDLSPQ